MPPETLRKIVLILIIPVLGLIALAVIDTYRAIKYGPELVGKKPYMFLQDSELMNRDQSINARVIFRKEERYCAVGVQQQQGRAWILLNYSDDLNGVYDLAYGKYDLTQQDYDEMTKNCDIDPRVSQELKRHIVGAEEAN